MSLDHTSYLLQSSQNASFLFVMNLAVLLSMILEFAINTRYMPYERDNAR